MSAYKFDIEPFETDFEFEDTLESFDEFAEEAQDKYGEEETWSFDPESADLLQDESPFLETESADWEYQSALDVLSPSEQKAVRITSTFETGRPGGFGGLTGNFDGQGLSFGLLNFTIKAGSLIPLLQEFINKYPSRYSAVFGKDAERFKDIVFATKPDPTNPKRRIRDVIRQMEFVNNQMNSIPRKAKSNRIIEPWKTYFDWLEKNPEFRQIQVRAVRGALDRARYWYAYFTLKTERGFAFMFDMVSSHGGAWLNATKFKGRRRALLRRMLDAKKAELGRDALTELEKLEVIANMIADVSLMEWREKVRVRKLWFVRGTGKVHGQLFDIRKDFGITDNAPDFAHGTLPPANPSEFAWEQGYGSNDEQAFEQRGATSTPTLLKREKAADGETLYVKIDLGMAKNLACTGIHVPHSFRPDSEIVVVLYLHGHKGDYPGNAILINGYWDGARFPFFALREEVNASEQNVIFVAPSLGPLSEAGSLRGRGGFDAFVEQVLSGLNEHYLMPRYGRRIPDVQSIILAAHSGGGSPMLNIAKGTDRYAAKIKACWCFDSMYGSVAPAWVGWAKSRPTQSLYVYYGPTKGQYNPKKGKKDVLPRDNAEAIACASKTQGLTNVCVQPSRAKAVGRVSAHFWVPKVHLKERLLNSPCLAGDICPHRRPRRRSELEVLASAGIDWRAVRDNAVALAKQEYELWDRGQRHETNPKYFETLKRYYVESGIRSAKEAGEIVRKIQCIKQLPSGKETRCYKRTRPWSAAFISWIMKRAGAGRYFEYSAGHHRYVSAAKKHKLDNNMHNPFWGYRISEVKPEVGDLICNARCDSKQPERCGTTYENVDKLKEPSLHCDIVVDVKSDHVLVIGGNTADRFGGLQASTVGMKKVLLDNSGKVRDGQRTNYIAVIKFRTDAASAPLPGFSHRETTPFALDFEPFEVDNEYADAQGLYEFEDTGNQFAFGRANRIAGRHRVFMGGGQKDRSGR